MITVIVGNKTDLSEKRQISTQEGEAKAQVLGSIFFETSAKTGSNVKSLFHCIAQKLPGSEGSNRDQDQGASNRLISPFFITKFFSDRRSFTYFCNFKV